MLRRRRQLLLPRFDGLEHGCVCATLALNLVRAFQCPQLANWFN